jgi:hypothetical protein
MVFLAACTVKVKSTTPLKKVFEAAEVRTLKTLNGPRSLVNATLQKRFGRETGPPILLNFGCCDVKRESTFPAFINTGTLRFTFDGERLQMQETPADVRQTTPFSFG